MRSELSRRNSSEASKSLMLLATVLSSKVFRSSISFSASASMLIFRFITPGCLRPQKLEACIVG